MGQIALRPSYWASVSGGKDSFYMLNLILHNLDKYTLDGVVHFELEIDYPFIRDVIDYMESECIKHGIRFVRIKPRQNWKELYDKYGFPTRMARWCNSKYKLDAERQLEDFLKQQGYYLVSYIGYCVDETKRYYGRKDANTLERYPLVEENINEASILEWAKKQPIYNNFYKTNRRCGCMYCPMTSMMNLAYLYKYYPENYNFMFEKIRETEKKRLELDGKPFAVMSSDPKRNADYFDNKIRTKWINILESAEKSEQLNLFDIL